MSEAVEAQAGALVEIRLARQAILTRDSDPLVLWAIISERALRSGALLHGAARHVHHPEVRASCGP
ncbi:Scr1 family TA system antitoxin-like transcriptional regulator [Streptomyces sp. NPDC014733]|uniref:Scr1 family TA system antitoxin-like transcriptional regulator n=1 Tax=Streptomyces sp. NPDC014733 TaxID=3364885 RepID=UPI0037004FD7